MADLSFLSNDELLALKAGDYSKLSNESLVKLRSDASNDLPSLLSSAGARKGPAMQPVMGRLKEAEETIVPQQPKGVFDQILESLATSPAMAPGMGMAGVGAPSTPAEAEQMAQGIKAGAQKVAPYVVGAAAPEVRVGGTVARMALTGGLGGGIGKVTESVVEGEIPKPAEVIEATTQGMALGPIIGVPLAKIGSGIVSSFQAGAGNRIRGFLSGFYRSLDELPGQFAKSADARERLFRSTGKALPMSIGEATQSQGILTAEERALSSLTASTATKATPTPQDMAAAERAVMVSIIGEAPGVSADDIGRNAINALEAELGPINENAKNAVRNLASDYAKGAKGTLEEIQARLASELPGPSGKSVVSVGENARKSMQYEVEQFTDEASDLFGKVRGHPRYREKGLGSLSNTEKVIRDEAEELLPDESGEILASAMPEGTRKFFTDLIRAEASPSLAKLWNYRQQVGASLKDRNLLPGASTRLKIKIYEGLTKDIDDAISVIGDANLSADWKAATKFFRENVDRFKSKFATGIAKDLLEGGKKPELIAEALIGPNAASERKLLEDAVGSAKARAIFDDANDLARDNVFEASLTGDMTVMSAMKAYQAIRRLPDVVRNEAFPNASRFLDIIKQELSAKGLPSTDQAVRSLMDFDSTKGRDILEMLSSSKRPDVEGALKSAAAAQADVVKAEQNAILKAINSDSASGLLANPRALVKGMASGKYSENDVRKAMNIILRESPETYKQVQFSFVEDLLESMVDAKGAINVDELVNALGVPKAGVGGTTGGANRAVAEAVLSAGSVSRLREAANDIAQIRGPSQMAKAKLNQPSGSAKDLTARTLAGALIGGLASGWSPGAMALSAAIGAGGGSATKGAMNAVNSMRYKLASRILIDDRFKRIASAPFTTRNLQTGIRLAAEAIALETDDEQELSQLNEIIQATSK